MDVRNRIRHNKQNTPRTTLVVSGTGEVLTCSDFRPAMHLLSHIFVGTNPVVLRFLYLNFFFHRSIRGAIFRGPLKIFGHGDWDAIRRIDSPDACPSTAEVPTIFGSSYPCDSDAALHRSQQLGGKRGSRKDARTHGTILYSLLKVTQEGYYLVICTLDREEVAQTLGVERCDAPHGGALGCVVQRAVLRAVPADAVTVWNMEFCIRLV